MTSEDNEPASYIGIHTLDEAAAGEPFRSAVLEAFAKIRTLEAKVIATRGVS